MDPDLLSIFSVSWKKTFRPIKYQIPALLHPGGMMSLAVKSKTSDIVKCEVIDGGELKSRRHLNVRGKSATLPSITGYSISGPLPPYNILLTQLFF